MIRARSLVRWLILAAVLALLTLPSLGNSPASADAFGAYAFQRLWSRTDGPMQQGTASRSWVWGSQPFTGIVLEQYVEGNADKRP